MKFYQNKKLVATFEKTSACLGENKETNKIEMLGSIWELKDDRENLIDNLMLAKTKAFNAEMLRRVCKKYKRKLALSDEEVEIIADNQEELEQQRIVLDIKG